MIRVLLLLFCILEVIAYKSGHFDAVNISSGVTRSGLFSDSSISVDLPAVHDGNGSGAYVSVKSIETSDQSEFFLIQTSACFGFCPVYKMQVFSDGRFVYDGYANVRRIGKFRGKFPSETFAKLLAAIDTFNFGKFVEAEGHPCQELSTDAPGVITQMQTHGKQLTIDHYRGCRGFFHEQELDKFENDAETILEIFGRPARRRL